MTENGSFYKIAEVDNYLLINHYLMVAENFNNYYLDAPLGCPKLPHNITLRPYQETAVNNWFNHQGRGILKMATGSGKTIISLAIATQLYQRIGLKVLIILCPYCHLVQQWGRVAEQFNLQPILAYDSIDRWQSIFSHQLYEINQGLADFLTIITTNDTLLRIGFQSQLKYLPEKTLIIGDECHHLGAKQRFESLPKHIGLRLGLSATPERHFDDLGTESIMQYFGSILEPEFTLKDAIAVGALVPYIYHPILVELTTTEQVEYIRLTQRINQLISYRSSVDLTFLDLSPDIKGLLVKRSRLVGGAINKLTALKELMKSRLDTSHTLFYCGDSSSDDHRQLNQVTQLLGKELGYRINTYTAETPLLEREKLRHQFINGELQGLVAIRCLDEGVDIPAIETAVILASSSNPRQFIQRRGRILRPDRQKKQATLYDMIVIPPKLDEQLGVIERQLVKKELKRFFQFANLALNHQQARKQLQPLQEQFNIDE